MKKKIFLFITTALLIISAVFPVSADENSENVRIKASMESFLRTDGGIIGISNRGEWDSFPENSIPAIEEAAKTDIDFVLVDVKKTSDGSLILFSDDTSERMLISDTVLTISETDLKTLSSLPLRGSCGGSNTEKSEYFIPTLRDAVSAAEKNDIPLILRCSAEITSAVAGEIKNSDAQDMCIIFSEGSQKEVIEAKNNCPDGITFISAIKGNVIFNIVSFVNKTHEAGFSGVNLRTTNRYGINYYSSLLSSYGEKMRIIADTAHPEINGARQDSEKWWDDLISRGYSVIITDHAELFSEYKTRNADARERLRLLYKAYVTDHTLPDFKDEALNDYKKAYTDAVSFSESLLGDNSASTRDINDCYSALNKAANDIKINFSALEDGSAGTTITVPRIILCIAAVAVVVTVQIYFFRRRKKVG